MAQARTSGRKIRFQHHEGKMPTCLVVDDSTVIRKIATRILESNGFDTEQAEDGSKALDACKAAMPDIVLLDWNMPVMNGLEFLEALRQLPNGGEPKVVFCTTETEFSRITEAMSKGADEYIMKPFDEDILMSKLELVGFGRAE